MAKESFRFIHTSDFHLERPLQDLLDLPEHLKRELVDAPWKAAESVFEHAVLENVDFVVLAGDILNPASCGAKGIAFLLDHFEVLRSRGIQVYWACGKADDVGLWPSTIPLPSNVHRFPSNQTERFMVRRNQSVLATVVGRSVDGNEIVRAAEYGHEPDDTFVIAVAHGKADADSLAAEQVHYWALGGNHQASIVQTEEPTIRYSGSPQARCLKEEGAHGCVLVDVDAQRQIQVHPIEVDLVRYSEQDIDADDVALGRDVRQTLAKRVGRLQSEASGRTLLVKWRIQMDLENAAVVGPGALEELLSWLRREFGHGKPCCWSTDIEILPPKQLPDKWRDEDTILGDFLRVADEHRKQQAKNLNLKPILDSEVPSTQPWAATLSPANSAAQMSTLEKSTLLGVDLLRGHQVDLLAPTRRYGGTKK